MGRPKGIISKIADETGLDQATVRRAMKSASISEAEAAENFESTVDAVQTFADDDKVIGHAANGRGLGGGNTEYAAAKAEAERHRAEKMRLQNEKLRGSLIDRASVEETGSRILGDLRVAILAVGVRVAPRVTGLTDAKDVARMIEDELRSTLTTYADGFIAKIEEEAALE